MVTEYGMSAKLGAVKYGSNDSEPFLGRDYGHQRDYSEDIAADIDTEVRDLIERAHDEAWEILVQYRDALDAMVLELVEKETLNKEDLERILGAVRKRPPHNTFSGFGKRTPSDRPPIEIPTSLTKSGSSSSNGSSNGAQPGVTPAPNPPGPPTPTGQPGAFGPGTGSSYGGYQPPGGSSYAPPEK
jgi:cell division protease FtsH